VLRNKFRIGVKKEKIVKKKLERRGWKVKQSSASRGASDLIAWKNGRKWFIQVKSTIKNKEPTMRAAEKRRLKIQASKGKGIPVKATVTRGQKIRFYSLRTGRRLKP